MQGVTLARRAVAGEPNRFSDLQVQLSSAGRTFLDLSDTNPTRHGLLDPAVLEVLAAAVPAAARYVPDPQGLLLARQALAAGRGGDPADYWLTASTSEAYSWLLTLLADPGDLVAVPAPGYPLVEPLARFSGVGTVTYPVHYLHPYGWTVDTGALAALVSDPKVVAVVLVNPGNPTGAYVEPDQQRSIIAACAATGTALVVDEVFGPFTLDGPAHSLAGTDRCLTFALDGLSKLLCAPQLKLGWIRASGPAAELAVARQGLDQIADAFLSVGAPVALALPGLLDLAPRSVARTRARLAANLATARRALGSPYRVRRCDGGWTALVDVPRYRGDDELLEALLRAGVLVHPGWLYDLASPGAFAVSLLPEPAVFEAGCSALRDAVDALA
jgi:hypothetical protein